MAVADTFEDMEKDACAIWTIGVTMYWYDHFEEAVVEFEKALELAADEVIRFRALCSLADICQRQEKWEESYDWANQALEHRPGEVDKSDLKVRLLLNVRAAAEIHLDKKEQAIETIEESRKLIPGTIEMMASDSLDSLTVLLAEQNRWDELMARIESWTLWDRFSWLLWTDDRSLRYDRFQEAAKKTGKVAFLVQASEEIIRYLDTAYPKSAGIARIGLAEAYHNVIRDDAKAKALYYQVLDADACVDLVSGEDLVYLLESARFEVADIIYEE